MSLLITVRVNKHTHTHTHNTHTQKTQHARGGHYHSKGTVSRSARVPICCHVSCVTHMSCAVGSCDRIAPPATKGVAVCAEERAEKEWKEACD